MEEKVFCNILLAIWFVLSVLVFVALFFISAPYGRHSRKGWGPHLVNRLGWLIMEVPAAVLFGVYYFIGRSSFSLILLVFLLMWEVHYVHRALIYPFSLDPKGSRMPLAVVGMGFFFNLINAYLNGKYVFSFARYESSWLIDPRFMIGLVVFVAGYYINRYSDTILKNLRSDSDGGYSIPRARFFNVVSSPNYMGEILIWVGWAVATWSPSGLVFAVWTMANLVPRARSHHEWYRQNFPEYPAERRALIPGLW